jgi:hypothetical protein
VLWIASLQGKVTKSKILVYLSTYGVERQDNSGYTFKKTYVTTATLPARSCSRSLGACISDIIDGGGISEDRVFLTTIVLEESQTQDMKEILRVEGDSEKSEPLCCFLRRSVDVDVGDPSGLHLISDMIVVMVVWSA